MAETPKIRFKGFVDAWEQRKLSELSDTFEYGLNAAAKEFDGENKYIRITDIDDASHEFNGDDVTSPDTDLANAENYKLADGDILFARTGASVGKTYIYKKSDGVVYYAGFLIRARIKKEYNPEFVFQNTLTADYEKYIAVTSQRSGQPGVNAQEYSEYKIMIPGKAEQDKVSAYLGSLDQIITLHQHKCDETKELKRYMLQKMFPRNGKKNPEIRFAGFTDDWEQRKLGAMTERVSTTGTSGKEFPSVEYEDVVSEQGLLNKNIYQKETIKIGIRFSGEDVLYGKLRPYLHNWLNPDFQGVAVGDWWVLKPINLDKNFLYMLIQSPQFDDMANQSSGTKMPRADWKLMSSTEFYVPVNLEEQQQIGEYFRCLDHLITLHQRKCDELKEVKKFMLQNMFPQKG